MAYSPLKKEIYGETTGSDSQRFYKKHSNKEEQKTEDYSFPKRTLCLEKLAVQLFMKDKSN